MSAQPPNPDQPDRPEHADRPDHAAGPEHAGAKDPRTALELSKLDHHQLEEQEQAEHEWHEHLPLPFRILDTVVKTVMVVLLAALIVAVGANVFGRYVLSESIAGSDEMARFLFIWVIFLGAALAHLHREHIAVELVVERLPAGWQRVTTVVQELVVLGVVLALLYSSTQVLAISAGSSALLDVPLWLINISVPVCAGLMALITLYRIVVALRPTSAQEV